MSSLLLFFAFFTILDNSIAADCALPSKSRLDFLLDNEVDSSGGEGGLDITPLNDTYYTCLVQGNTNGRYQDLSVIMQYTVSGSSDPSTRTRQFEAFCSGGIDWTAVSSSLTTPPNNYMSLGLRTDCSDCDLTASNDNHCTGCNPSCTEGLMRCTSDSSSDCCAAFEEDGTCKTDLDCNQPNFVATEQNNYTCACGLSCGDGYTLNSSSCSCYLTDICAAITPCNNGECILGSSADIYTCNCTGTNFMGTNCSDPVPVPSSTAVKMSSSVIVSAPDSSSTMMTSSSSTPPAPVSSSSSSATATSTTDDSTTMTSTPSTSVSPSVDTVSGDRVFIPAIVISVIIGILLIIILIVTIFYVIYYMLAGKGFDMAKAKANTPFANGESHNNPLYLKPDEVTSEVANLYTPSS